MNRTKEEIANMLLKWRDEGKLNSKAKWNIPPVKARYAAINRLIAKGIISRTKLSNIVCTPDIVDEFNELVDAGLINDTNGVSMKYNLNTQFALQKFASEGNVLRFSGLGNNTPIYIG